MTTNPSKPKRQPMKINYKGVHYTLHTKFKWIDEERGICIGPLYRMEKHDESTLYLPDAAFLYADQELGFMHAINFGQRPKP